MNRPLPLTAILLGLLGLVPLIVCGVEATAENASAADQSLAALIGYAALGLSFFGGVHWGLALSDGAADARAQRIRYALGVVPALLGWAAWLLALVFPGWPPLLLLIGAFALTVLGEARAAHLGYAPRGYMLLRWALSAAAVALLTTVLTVRLLGAHIRF